MAISELNGTAEEKATASVSRSSASDYSVPVRTLRWFVIQFFKIVEGIIHLSVLIYYGLKTIVVLVFHYFWPYPVYFRRHK